MSALYVHKVRQGHLTLLATRRAPRGISTFLLVAATALTAAPLVASAHAQVLGGECSRLQTATGDTVSWDCPGHACCTCNGSTDQQGWVVKGCLCVNYEPRQDCPPPTDPA